MIRSMTGFGVAEGTVGAARVAVEIRSVNHRYLEPQLRLPETLRQVEMPARELLRGWDYTTPAGDSDSAASAAYYNAVWRNLVKLLFDDELPVGLKSDGGARWRAAVTDLLDDPDSAWWDNKLTPNITESRDEILRQSLVQARLELTRELGKDPGQWQWGKLHRLTLEHPVLGGESMPGAVRWLVNEGPFDVPGGSAIVNANGWNASLGYEVTAGPVSYTHLTLPTSDIAEISVVAVSIKQKKKNKKKKCTKQREDGHV